MPAPTLLIGYTWPDAGRVTAARMNQTVNSATIQVSAAGKFPVRQIASSGAGACDGEADLTDLQVTRSRPSHLQVDGLTSLVYAGTVDLDFDGGTDLKTIPLAGNVTLTTSNKAAGKSAIVRIVADGSARTLTFPSQWVFVTDLPASIAASKTAQLVLMCYGTAETDIVAAWAVQS